MGKDGYISKVFETCDDISSAAYKGGLEISAVMTPDLKHVIFVSRDKILGNFEDEIDIDGNVFHTWKPVDINYKSLINREITGKNISFVPMLKTWANRQA